MESNPKIGAYAWYSPEDRIIKVRLLYKEQGVLKGVIIYLTEEMFQHIGEGQQIPRVAPSSVKTWDPDNPRDESPNRWSAIGKEIE